MTSVHIIKQLKAIFSRHGVPECVVSDNGTQYTSEEFNILALYAELRNNVVIITCTLRARDAAVTHVHVLNLKCSVEH